MSLKDMDLIKLMDNFASEDKCREVLFTPTSKFALAQRRCLYPVWFHSYPLHLNPLRVRLWELRIRIHRNGGDHASRSHPSSPQEVVPCRLSHDRIQKGACPRLAEIAGPTYGLLDMV